MKHLSGQPYKLTILVRACRRQALHRPLARAQQEQPRTSRSQSRRQKPDLFADWHSTALFKYSKGFSIPVNLSWLITKKYITIHDTPTNYKTITYGCWTKNTTQHFWTLNQWYFAAVRPTSLWGLPLFISQQTIVIKHARIFTVYKNTTPMFVGWTICWRWSIQDAHRTVILRIWFVKYPHQNTSKQANISTLIPLYTHYSPIYLLVKFSIPIFLPGTSIYIYTYIIYIYANAHESSLPPGSFQE
jgi:hypothetical protein